MKKYLLVTGFILVITVFGVMYTYQDNVTGSQEITSNSYNNSVNNGIRDQNQDIDVDYLEVPEVDGQETPGQSPRFDTQQENDQLIITDPVNETRSYNLTGINGLVELNASRGQLSKHYYNTTSRMYRFESSYHVIKEGLKDDTGWVTPEEYPEQFIIRLLNGSIYRFDTANQIEQFFSHVANNTVWGVGVETSRGILGFYTDINSQTASAQYIWYPRLQNGRLPAYNQPLYAIYTRLFTNKSGVIHDAVLHDRSLFPQNPVNQMVFTANQDKLEIYYWLAGLDIQGSIWDVVHGFKYNFTDQQYHVITRYRCRNVDFDDLGTSYEITVTDQAKTTGYRPGWTSVSNETLEKTATIEQALDIGTYLENFYSNVEITSVNNQSKFYFDFSDMEQAGFSQKVLRIHEFTVPGSDTRKALLAGMYGFGSYLRGVWVDIDPSTGDISSVDGDDLFTHWSYMSNPPDEWAYITTNTDMDCGTDGSSSSNWDYEWAFISFDTDLSTDIIVTDSHFTMTLKSEFFESGEGVDIMAYNIGNNHDYRTCTESNTTWRWGTFTDHYSLWRDGDSGTNSPVNESTTGVASEWASLRNSNEDYICFIINCENNSLGGFGDTYEIYESTFATVSYRPVLVIEYTINQEPLAPTINDDGDNVYPRIEETIQVSYTDPDGQADLDDCYLEAGYETTYTVKLQWNVDTDTLTEVTGGSYVFSTTVTENSITNGYRLDWKVKFDWGWSMDGTDVDYRAYHEDECNAASSTTSETSTGETFEDDVIFSGVSYTLSDSAYSEDGNTALTSNEWFRGGAGVYSSGNIYFYGTSVLAPLSSGTVTLWADGASTAATDTTISTGQFQTSTFTTPTTSGLDTDYDFDVELSGLPSGCTDAGTDQKQDNRRDNELPTSYNCIMASGVFHASITNDNTPACSSTGATDGSGAGLHSTQYKFAHRTDGGSWTYSGWQASNSYTPTISSSTQDLDFAVQVRDKVGNEGSWVYDNDNTVDLVAPGFSSIGGSESSTWLHAPGSSTDYGYYSDLMGPTPVNFAVIGSVTDNYGLEKATTITAFGDSPADDTLAGTSDSFSFTYSIVNTDSGTVVVTVTLYDQAGNTAQDSFTFYEDNDPPDGTLSVLLYYWSWGQDVTVFMTATDAQAGVRSINPYTWYFDELGLGPVITNASQYTWSGSLFSPGYQTLQGGVYDHVGNYQNATEIWINVVYFVFIDNPHLIEEPEYWSFYEDSDVYDTGIDQKQQEPKGNTTETRDFEPSSSNNINPAGRETDPFLPGIGLLFGILSIVLVYFKKRSAKL
ncbi:MAG: hypothetical protein ACFFD4_02525 [Candidatus Odinarchaeota archaeon]